MDSAATACDASWSLQDFVAQGAFPPFAGQCDLLTPARGLHQVRLHDAAWEEASLLGVELPAVDCDQPETRVEAFSRGGDLIATYQATEAYPLRSQIYWRLASHGRTAGNFPALAAIELVASQQTDLLDSSPEIRAVSTLPAEEVHWLVDPEVGQFCQMTPPGVATLSRSSGAACFVVRLPGGTFSYAEMVYPPDFETSELETLTEPARVCIAHRLFAQRLEKGVILRARVLGLLLERKNDLRAAAAHYQAFANSELPLTT